MYIKLKTKYCCGSDIKSTVIDAYLKEEKIPKLGICSAIEYLEQEKH